MVFYAKDDEGRRGKDSRDQVGNLKAIHSVGKYITRLGQVVSQTLGFVQLDKDADFSATFTPKEMITFFFSFLEITGLFDVWNGSFVIGTSLPTHADTSNKMLLPRKILIITG